MFDFIIYSRWASLARCGMIKYRYSDNPYTQASGYAEWPTTEAEK